MYAGRRAVKRQGMKADPLSPMVDIVFLLLAFFVLVSAIIPRDTEARLDCSRQPTSEEIVIEVPVDSMRVLVESDGVSLNGRHYRGPTALAALTHQLVSLAVFSKQTPVRVACMPDSPHRLLVGVLNALNHAEFTKVGVCSL